MGSRKPKLSKQSRSKVSICPDWPQEEKWEEQEKFLAETKVNAVMLRFSIAEENPMRKKFGADPNVRFRVVGGRSETDEYENFFLGHWWESSGRDFFPRNYKVGRIEGEILGPFGKNENPGRLTTLMIPVGEGEFKYQIIALIVKGEEEKIIGQSKIRKVNLSQTGKWTIWDNGGDSHDSYELIQENEPTSTYASSDLWPVDDKWQVMESYDRRKPSFAIRGPKRGESDDLPSTKANKMLVYFHGVNAVLDQGHNSLFTFTAAPPGLDDAVLDDAIILCPNAPKYLDGSPRRWLEYPMRGRNDYDEPCIQKAAEDLHFLIQKVRKHYSVPDNQISCYGFSDGGYAVLELCSRYPDLFKKAGCMAGHFYESASTVARSFPAPVPLAIFHCVNDETCKVEYMYELIRKLKENAKTVSYSITVAANYRFSHASLANHQALQEGFMEWAFNDDPELRVVDDSTSPSNVLLRDPHDSSSYDWDGPYISQRNPVLDLWWLEPKYAADYKRLHKNECEIKNHNPQYKKKISKLRKSVLHKSASMPLGRRSMGEWSEYNNIPQIQNNSGGGKKKKDRDSNGTASWGMLDPCGQGKREGVRRAKTETDIWILKKGSIGRDVALSPTMRSLMFKDHMRGHTICEE